MKAALYRLSEFLEIKKRLLDIRENARGAIKTTDKDIAKTALIAKGFREAGQTAANTFRTFADKPEVDYSQKEQKHPFSINQFRTDQCQVTVSHFQYFIIPYQYRALDRKSVV